MSGRMRLSKWTRLYQNLNYKPITPKQMKKYKEREKKLIKVLNNLVNKGNTMIIIEHNLDVVKTADWVVDLGPEGGSGGGKIIAQGTPEDVARSKKSHTGTYIKKILAGIK